MTRSLSARGDHGIVPVYVIRHVLAEPPEVPRGPDLLRPASPAGRAQALALARALGDAGLTSLVSSPALRCIQTLEPLSAALGIAIEIAQELAEGRPAEAARDLLLAAATGGPTAICTHGDVLQGLVRAALDASAALGEGHSGFAEGSIWRLDVRGWRIEGATPVSSLPDPA